MQGGFQLHTESAPCWNSKLLHTMRCLWEDGANVSIHSGVVFFCRGDKQFTYCFNE